MTKTLHTYCPRCGCTKLDVIVTSTATLEFKDTSEPAGQMETIDGRDFDDTHTASCTRCGFAEALGAFRSHVAFAPAPVAPAGLSWHLFYIEASDADGVHAYIVSAESQSAAKAEELARAAVLDHDSVGTEDEPGEIDHCERIGATDADVFQSLGLLASH